VESLHIRLDPVQILRHAQRHGELSSGIITPGADFPYIFSGENSAENFAENFPPKILGKIEFSAEKSFEKSFFRVIPRNFPRKVIFR
jgi:hypothetical protein